MNLYDYKNEIISFLHNSMKPLEESLIKSNFPTHSDTRYVAGIYEGYRRAIGDIEEKSNSILSGPLF